MWRALAHPARRKILERIKERPHTTGELADGFEMTRFGVMKHLDVLEEAELIRVERRGRRRLNHFNVAPLHQVDSWLRPLLTLWSRDLLRARGFELSDVE